MEIIGSKEVLPVKTTTKKFFVEYLTIKKPFLEHILSRVNKKKIVIHPKPLRVFALLLYYNYTYRAYENGVKWKMVFDYSTKVEIMNELDINEGQLNTYLSTLRLMKLLNGKSISEPFIFYPEDEKFELTFSFIFTDKNEDTSEVEVKPEKVETTA